MGSMFSCSCLLSVCLLQPDIYLDPLPVFLIEFWFHYCRVVRLFMQFGCSSIIAYVFCNRFSQSVACLFIFLNRVFCRAGVFNFFKKAQLLFFLSCAFGLPTWIFIVFLVQFTELTSIKGLEGGCKKKKRNKFCVGHFSLWQRRTKLL